jgi:hypothetical protein
MVPAKTLSQTRHRGFDPGGAVFCAFATRAAG